MIFAAAAAGVQVVSKEHKRWRRTCWSIADVNAVPPPGVEGMELFMNGEKLPGCDALGVGPLAIGDIKYKCESGLFKQMITSDKPLMLDFRHALCARETARRPRLACGGPAGPDRCILRAGACAVRPARRL